jgi:voltage-gated potassium channel
MDARRSFEDYEETYVPGGTGSNVRVLLPRGRPRPARALTQRAGIALLMVLIVALSLYLDPDGYHDEERDQVDLVGALYYATVTVTTTGYGDITPVTDRARLVTALVVTPARIVFLIVLIGTSVEVLTERWRRTIHEKRWRRRVEDHYVICGFGVLGRSAAEVLLAEEDRDDIVVVEADRDLAERAASAGFAVVQGDLGSRSVLREAGVERAHAVIVATDRDDAAVLATLTARELRPEATIVAAVHERENRHLLVESGADTVITAAESSGRLLGLATHRPAVVAVLQDLLTVGEGLELVEHAVTEEEAGAPKAEVADQLTLVIVRDDEVLRFDDPRVSRLEAGDVLFGLRTRPPDEEAPSAEPDTDDGGPLDGPADEER